MTNTQQRAKQLLDELDKDLATGGLIESAVGAVLKFFVPLTAVPLAISKLIGPPGKLVDYRNELQEVVDGKRFTIPERPELSPKDFGR